MDVKWTVQRLRSNCPDGLHGREGRWREGLEEGAVKRNSDLRSSKPKERRFLVSANEVDGTRRNSQEEYL